MTPTQRTIRALRERGFVVGIAERWLPGVGIRSDLFGWVDLVALDPGRRQIWAVQSTGEDFAGHIRKMLTEREDAVRLWLHCRGRAELWGWRPILDRRLGRKTRRPRIAEFYLSPEGALRWTEWSPSAPGPVEMGA